MSSLVDWTAVAAIIGAVATFFAGLWTWRTQQMEGAGQITDASINLWEAYRQEADDLKARFSEVNKRLQRQSEKIHEQDRELQRQDREMERQAGRIGDLEGSVKRLREHNRALQEGIEQLIRQLMGLGHDPVWRPPKDWGEG